LYTSLNVNNQVKAKKSSAASCNRNGLVNEQDLTSLSKWFHCNMLNSLWLFKIHFEKHSFWQAIDKINQYRCVIELESYELLVIKYQYFDDSTGK
jgi:hypothetical protein